MERKTHYLLWVYCTLPTWAKGGITMMKQSCCHKMNKAWKSRVTCVFLWTCHHSSKGNDWFLQRIIFDRLTSNIVFLQSLSSGRLVLHFWFERTSHLQASLFTVRFIELPKTVEYIGMQASYYFHSLKASFIPSTVKSMQIGAFVICQALSLFVLTNNIDFSYVGTSINHH